MKKLAIITIIVLSACGSLKVRDKDIVATEKIKKAAIVSFSVFQPASAKLSLNLSSGSLEGQKGGSMFSQRSPHVEKMYADLSQEFGKKWKMVGVKTMTLNAGYQKAYKDTMEGWQNKMPPGEGQKQFLVEKVMDSDSTRILGVEGRRALMDSLGVDAIVEARVMVSLTGTTVMGIGSRYPKTRLSFKVFTRDNENPVWFDGSVEGPVSETSVGSTAFIDETLLGSVAAESAKSAFEKIGTL